MSDDIRLNFEDNPDFNNWLEENYAVDIEDYSYPSSSVLYKISVEDYFEALERYKSDPKVALSRIENYFPTPIAYYFYQAGTGNNYQNDHHRLDLLKSCWESIIFTLYGLVVGEARHRKIPLKSLGIKWDKYWSDKINNRLLIIENILDHVTKSGIRFDCAKVIPLSTVSLVRKLNQERNGFEHAFAKTSAQQQALYAELYPQLESVLRQLIKLEEVKLFRYYSAELPLYPKCEIFNGSSLEGWKEIITLQKSNYIDILDYFNAGSVFAKVEEEAFCVSPFIHFHQEIHETNAVLCFFKQEKSGKYDYEVTSKSQKQQVEKSVFIKVTDDLRSLVV